MDQLVNDAIRWKLLSRILEAALSGGGKAITFRAMGKIEFGGTNVVVPSGLTTNDLEFLFGEYLRTGGA